MYKVKVFTQLQVSFSKNSLDIVNEFLLEFLADPAYLIHLEKNWNNLAPFILDYNNTVVPSEMYKTNKEVKAHYLGKDEISKASFPKLLKVRAMTSLSNF